MKTIFSRNTGLYLIGAAAAAFGMSVFGQDFDSRLKAFEAGTAQLTTKPKPVADPTCTCTEFPDAHDGIHEVNARRAAKGLPPFKWDAGLTAGAMACATYRATHLIEGHTSNDFACLPAGCSCDATGCAAWDEATVRALYWGSCCSDEPWEYAGAAWVRGSDGRRYMCLFVRRQRGVFRTSMMLPTEQRATMQFAPVCRS